MQQVQQSSYVRMHIRLTALAAALLVSACASKPINVPYNPGNFGAPDPVAVAKAPEIIGPGDKVQVKVYQEETLSGVFQVQADGQIDYPLIGLIQAQGRTGPELAAALTERLRQKHLRKPDVQVAISEAATQTITIDGAVNKPGVVPIAGTTTLIRAVALAQGTAEEADAKQVIVFRQVNGQRMAAAFDLQAIRRAEANDPIIYPNDVVVVGTSSNKFRGILKDVLSAVPVLGVFRPF